MPNAYNCLCILANALRTHVFTNTLAFVNHNQHSFCDALLWWTKDYSSNKCVICKSTQCEIQIKLQRINTLKIWLFPVQLCAATTETRCLNLDKMTNKFENFRTKPSQNCSNFELPNPNAATSYFKVYNSFTPSVESLEHNCNLLWY